MTPPLLKAGLGEQHVAYQYLSGNRRIKAKQQIQQGGLPAAATADKGLYLNSFLTADAHRMTTILQNRLKNYAKKIIFFIFIIIFAGSN
jgi:hypothetical protein